MSSYFLCRVQSSRRPFTPTPLPQTLDYEFGKFANIQIQEFRKKNGDERNVLTFTTNTGIMCV